MSRQLLVPSRNTSLALAVALFALATIGYAGGSQPADSGIGGSVVAAGPASTPVRGAIVTLTGNVLTRPRSTVTDARGEFRFRGLSAGIYRLAASKPPYLTMSFGASVPNRPGESIVLPEGRELQNLVIGLPRSAVITGTIRSTRNEAVANVRVRAVRTGRRSLLRVGLFQSAEALTDERGEYRLFGLEPGAYVVVASPPYQGGMGPLLVGDEGLNRRVEALALISPASPIPEAGRPFAPASYMFVPLFYPGTATPTDAAPVTVAPGEVVAGIDISFQALPSGRVRGKIVRADGLAVSPVDLSMRSAAGAIVPPSAWSTPRLSSQSPEGDFEFAGVAPGQYTIVARTQTSPSGADSVVLEGASSLTSTGGDDTSVVVVLRSLPSISGKVLFAGAGAPELSSIRMHFIPANPPVAVDSPKQLFSVPVQRSGAFSLRNVSPGTYRVSSNLETSAWLVQSVEAGSSDPFSLLVNVEPDVPSQDIVVTFSSTLPDVAGILHFPASALTTDYGVIVAPVDERQRVYGSNRLRVVYPTRDGTFVLRSLPPGDYLVAVATAVDEEDLDDAPLLKQLLSSGIPLKVDAGKPSQLDLTVRR